MAAIPPPTTTTPSPDITIRLASASDLPHIGQLHFDAYRTDSLNQWVLPHRSQHPWHAYMAMLHVYRQTFFASPTSRFIVAQDNASGALVGMAAWSAEGSSALARRWAAERNPWVIWLEGHLISWERWYWRHVRDKAGDYARRGAYLGAMGGASEGLPAHLYCVVLAVDPAWQRRGIGRQMLRWGEEVARDAELPIVLSTSPVAEGLYRSEGFREFRGVDVKGFQRIKILMWESEGCRGRWLEEKGEGSARLKGGEV